jgi:hypothetical protein
MLTLALFDYMDKFCVGGTRGVCVPLAIAYGSDENEEYELIYSRWESSWRGCFNI